MLKKISILCFLSILISCEKSYLLQEVSADDSGVNFTNEVKEKGKANILDYLYFYNGGGVSVGDINNDNLPDLYFVSNQGKNKLYLNKGNLQFDDISANAGIEGNSTWDTGVTMTDINGDGWLDIYVCSVVGINEFTGQNQLYINNKNGTFSEKSKEFGLDFKNYSTQASFFDFDKDGDLDMYLLNQNIHNPLTFGTSENRNVKNENAGGKLLRNDKGKFIDISTEAGIYGGQTSYGLGISVADFNQDGWDDIYISNDFHEDDYLYINQQNGTFKDERKNKITTTSKFSMGNDAADINHDGFSDLISIDMLPKEEKYLKISPNDDDFEIQKLKTEMGYLPQQMRNCLQINQQGKHFSEQAWLYGVAATDWSWSPLFADFDLDGNTDLFIGAGIAKRPNDMDYIKYISNDEIRSKLNSSGELDQTVIDKMASGAVKNYIYAGKTNQFIDKTNDWMKEDILISNGAVYTDLDNDGDLDLVLNNYNSKSKIFKNTTENKYFLKVKFKTPTQNTFGIGTKIYAYYKGKLFYNELQTTRGFQSSVEPIIHFGLGNCKQLDSMRIIWNDDTTELLKNIKTNQTLSFTPSKNRKKHIYKTQHNVENNIADEFGLNVQLPENEFNDLNREKLIPYKITNESAALSVGDIDGNGTHDIFIGSSKGNLSHIFLQNNGKFKEKIIQDFEKDRMCEDMDSQFLDVDNDKDLDLIIISGGGEFYGKAMPLLNRIYINDGKGNFKKEENRLPKTYENSSVVRSVDYDNDGDLDLFIGGRAVANQFGKIPISYLLLNDGKGYFSIQKNEDLQKVGMVKDAIWTDINSDKKQDLIVIGEWFSPQIFINKKNKLVNETAIYISQNISGLWQTVQQFDIDNDGDLDFLLGNFGINTRFFANEKTPLQMYVDDFDQNGKTETFLSMYNSNNYYPINSKDELQSQLVSLIGKKYVFYKDFAGKTTEQIFDSKLLNKAKKFEIHTLASGYLRNDNSKLTFVQFPNSLQISPLKNLLYIPEYKAILAIGNAKNVSPYLGNIDSDAGNLIFSNKKIIPILDFGFNYFSRQINKTAILKIQNKNYIISVANNNKLILNEVK